MKKRTIDEYFLVKLEIAENIAKFKELENKELLEKIKELENKPEKENVERIVETMQKTEFYDTYECGYDLSGLIQKEIDNGWNVKHVIQVPFETYHGGDLFKPQIAITIIFEKGEKDGL